MSENSRLPNPSPLANLNPYQGIRAEVDLLTCELSLTQEPGGEVLATLELLSERQIAEPSLQHWGQGVSLLDARSGKQRSMPKWLPEMRYGLVLGADLCLLAQPEATLIPHLTATQTLIYPGQYTRRPGQGPFDLFASADARWLVVVNRNDGWAQLFDVAAGKELARHRFTALAGPKLISAAISTERGRVWLCGLDDRQIWSWNPLNGEVEPRTGSWRQPSALVYHQQGLWLLDASSPMRLGRLDPESLELQKDWKLPASSYGKETDTPGDLLALVGDKPWLAILGFENLPDPLTPKVVLFEPQTCRISEYQPSRGQWPVMLATAHLNEVCRQLMQKSRELAGQDPAEAPTVLALLKSYGLSWDHFPSRLLIIKAEKANRLDLPRGFRSRVFDLIRRQLKSDHGIQVAEPPRNEAERQLMVHTEQIVELLRSHAYLEVVIYQLFESVNLTLALDRAELLGDTVPETAGGAMYGQQADARAEAEEEPELVDAGWLGFADSLNSRLIQLNPELEPVWELDSTLFGVFRPACVCWLAGGAFALLDTDRSEVSAWDAQGNRLWVIQSDGSVWSRFFAAKGPKGLVLTLLDRDQQVLIQVNPQSEVLWDADSMTSKPQDMLDCCSDGQGGLWLLQFGGKLSRIDAQGHVLCQYAVEGNPSALALSEDGRQLALFDLKSQTLSAVRTDSGACGVLTVIKGEGHRLQDPVQLMWSDEQELILTDPYRLLRYRIGSQELTHRLLQSLRRKPGRANLAPEALFVARQQREAQLQGGSRASIRKMLEKVTLFENAPEELYQDLIDKLQTRVFNRGELIVKKGQIGDAMFLLRQGYVEVLGTRPDEIVARMGAGDVFGEVAMMLGTPRNATIRASGYAETFQLDQEGLDDLLPAYPELRERLFRLAQQRATQQKLRTEDALNQLRTRVQKGLASSPAARESGPVRAQGTGQGTMPGTGPGTMPVPGAEPSSGLGTIPVKMPAALAPLRYWVRHSLGNQLVELDRRGQALHNFAAGETFAQPIAAVPAAAGGFWLLDAGHHCLFKMAADRSLARFDEWRNLSLNQPRDLALGPDGSLWIVNSGDGSLIQLSADGGLMRVVPGGRCPVALQVLANGQLLVTDQRQHTVSLLDDQGQTLWLYGTPRKFGRDENLLFAPEYAQRLDSGNTLIADTGNSRVIEVDPQGQIVWSLIPGGALKMLRPNSVRRLDSGNTLIGHSNQSRWLEVNPQMLPVWRHHLPAEPIHSI